MSQTISKQTLQRLPLYLNYLKGLSKVGAANISAKSLAEALDLGEIQVRKDLAQVSSGGKPRIGYILPDLIRDLEVFLGYDDMNDAVLVGAGRLGRALLSYDGFTEYGLNIVAAFDTNPSVIGEQENGKQIFPLEKLEDLCTRMKIKIGVITVPAAYAQQVCDRLVACGILAIWNFSPTHLSVSEDILVKSENMAASLAILSKHLSEKINF